MYKPTKRVKNLKYAIRDVLLPANKLEKQGKKILKLNIGDPEAHGFKTPINIQKALFKAVKQGHTGYSNSEDNKQVAKAICKRQKRLHKTIINPSQVLATIGVSEAIFMLYASLIEKGNNIIIPKPYYPVYESYGTIFGQKPVMYNTDENWEPNLEDIKNKINKKTKALVIINPNNPTGAVYSEKTLKKIVNLAGQYKLNLISDEIYDQLAFKKYTSLGKVCKEVPSVVMSGISKNHLASGFRIGFMTFLNNKKLCDSCNKLSRIRLSVPNPMQYAMIEALNGPQKHVTDFKKKLIKQRNYIMKRINSIDGLSCVKPEGAFYAFIKLDKIKDDKKWVLDLLHKKHVLTVYGSGFGVPGYFRIVYLPSTKILEKAFDKIESFMK